MFSVRQHSLTCTPFPSGSLGAATFSSEVLGYSRPWNNFSSWAARSVLVHSQAGGVCRAERSHSTQWGTWPVPQVTAPCAGGELQRAVWAAILQHLCSLCPCGFPRQHAPFQIPGWVLRLPASPDLPSSQLISEQPHTHLHGLCHQHGHIWQDLAQPWAAALVWLDAHFQTHSPAAAVNKQVHQQRKGSQGSFHHPSKYFDAWKAQLTFLQAMVGAG